MRYGTSEVVLDIKAENILKYARVAQYMGEDVVQSRFEAVDALIDGSSIDVVLLDGSRMVVDVASMLIAYLEGKGKSIESIHATSKVRVAGREARLFKGIDSIGSKAVLISRAALDPLFKYSCTATALMRLDGAVMHDAYRRFISDDHSGIRDIIDSYTQDKNLISLEVLYGDGLIDLIVCDTTRSYAEVHARLDGLAYATDLCRSIIASPGHAYRLSDALTALWNCSTVLRDDGIIVVMAECMDGLGAKALQMLVEGRIRDANTYEGYIDGLEYIHILDVMGERGYDIGLLTMLPDLYVKALGFKPFRKVKDVLAYILGKMGQRHKVMIVSDALTIPMKRVP
ncbi:hypothetical protein HRbin04_00330 [archaeon HR04]|nr:hypothetical protein HRbin04_00330 [archaeon HR04]